MLSLGYWELQMTALPAEPWRNLGAAGVHLLHVIRHARAAGPLIVSPARTVFLWLVVTTS